VVKVRKLNWSVEIREIFFVTSIREMTCIMQVVQLLLKTDQDTNLKMLSYIVHVKIITALESSQCGGGVI